MSNYKTNIRIVLSIRIFYSMIFSISVISLFWKSRGLDLFDIFLLQGIFALSIVIFEIPTGYIGDQIGRKNTLILSALTASAGWFLYSFADSFASFVFVEIVLGIAFSLISGTDTSLIYESLTETKNEKNFTRIEGRQHAAVMWTEGLGALAGGIAAYFVPIKYLFYPQSLVCLTAFISAFFIIEPHRTPYRHPKGTFYGLYKIARYIFLRSRLVKFAVPLSAVCSLATMLGVWLYQPLWEERGVQVWAFGALWAALNLPAGIASHFAHEIEKKLGKALTIRLIPLPAFIGYVLLAVLPGFWVLTGPYIVSVTRGLTGPVIGRYIHEETYSDKRATVMSVQSWIFRLLYFIIGPAIGLIARNFGVGAAFMVCAAITAVSTIIFIPLFTKRLASDA